MNFRVARHTNDLQTIIYFYTTVLQLDVLGNFDNHNHYNGVFLGKKDLDWHLEFTQSNEKTNHQFDADDLLIFYPKTELAYQAIIKNIHKQNIPIQQAKNPYWNTNGVYIKDPDGYGIIISALKIEKI